MLSDITLGQYFPGHSWLHKLDPRTKLIATLFYISSIFTAESLFSYALVALFAVFCCLLSKVPVKILIKSVRPLWVIIVLTLGIHLFFTPGTLLFQLGPIQISWEGMRMGIFMSLRLVLLILFSSLLTLTTSPIALTDGIERLLRPFKVLGIPAHELAMMMTIALRFIPTLLEETERIMKAQMARGAEFSSGSLIARAKNLVPLLVPLFISAFRRADELATAMEARCYRGGEGRTRMKELFFTGRDWIGLAVILIFCGSLVYLRLF
ncbi:energy-coupling factor transport system permease protein [Sporomusaceae bacterium BoRhaA]|uniref:energy-coupling factor transporter transmembrane component T family protein n=1 Tax=Pelorhabdus rhamnosifermentans TaxID=2772457 RepID=UPI001C062618|nr:energy-coupling factor transporter transmembrane component T [Pelorhabdus rhamnosifermentans]MBU2701648.1 energy-coupling factor transport system permease protein [Pelorhabdus rhamnosifermentans]